MAVAGSFGSSVPDGVDAVLVAAVPAVQPALAAAAPLYVAAPRQVEEVSFKRENCNDDGPEPRLRSNPRSTTIHHHQNQSRTPTPWLVQL